MKYRNSTHISFKHIFSCVHTMELNNSPLISELKIITTMLYFLIQIYVFDPNTMGNQFAIFAYYHILHINQTNYNQERNLNPIHFQWFGELSKHTCLDLQMHLS